MVKDVGAIVSNLPQEKRAEFKKHLEDVMNDKRCYHFLGGKDYEKAPGHDIKRIKKNLYKSLFFGSNNFETGYEKEESIESLKTNEPAKYPLNTYESETV